MKFRDLVEFTVQLIDVTTKTIHGDSGSERRKKEHEQYEIVLKKR